jgi:hypothetical protein
LSSVVGFELFCRGLGNFRSGFAPLGLRTTYQLFDKSPDRHSKMPKTTLVTSQASSSRPTIEQWEIIFETTFNIDGDFKKFEATQWVVQEFKRRGLKKLFKLVTSTAYTKLIVQFYENLLTDYNRQGVLFSIVQGKKVDVTSSNIAAALKCNDEHPPEDAQLGEQPESFYILEIIEGMCTGQYADDKNNAGSQSKLPPQLWLVDSILQCNVCPLGHKM